MKMFIIDDDEVSLFLLRKKFSLEGLSEGKEIHAYFSAKEALDSLAECSQEDLPNVVLLDLDMPEMDGWQFLEAIAPFESRLKGRCRIYILTSSFALSDEARAKENSMVAGFIRKPISTEDISKLSS